MPVSERSPPCVKGGRGDWAVGTKGRYSPMWGGTPPLIAKGRTVFSVFHRPGAPRPLPGAFLSCVGKKGSKEADRGGAECRAPARQSRPPLALPGAHLETAKRRI